MDERQIEILAERIVRRIMAEQEAFAASANTAYVIMPETETAAAADSAAALMRSAAERYGVKLVIPDDSSLDVRSLSAKADAVIQRSSMPKLQPDDICIFVSASRQLIISCALLLKLDFESDLLIGCIENGNSVYLFRDLSELTGREPREFIKKIQDYERQLRSYGVHFDCLPKAGVLGAGSRVHAPEKEKKKIITAKDIKDTGRDGSIYVTSQDIVTDLAEETARKLNVEIICR